jgi:predicted chitinase
MGSLEVSLIKTLQGNIDSQEDTYVVRYLNPFYGVTSVRYEGNNSSNFNDVQKSYGMWFIPPDVGTLVMVIFIDGDPNQGYWMGCVQDQFQNHMVPGIAASQQTSMTQEQKDKYFTTNLPVAEFLKSTQDLNIPNVDKIAKPIHPFADRLLAQGLLLDTVRGITSSSARREVPSQVFGISTPGPLDTSPGAKQGEIGYETKVQAPVSRLGGSTFVMDDGDVNGLNELIRIRTRTGHQILLHNSSDLIYIANSKGSAWVELTSNGKIDMYAEDSVSIHTKADFNFRADRDFNLEAGRSINMKAMKNLEINVQGFMNLLVDDYAKWAIRDNLDLTVGQVGCLTVGSNFNLAVGSNINASASADVSLAAGGDLKLGASGQFGVGASGELILSGSEIHLNGPAAPAPEAPESAEVPPPLPTYSLPDRDISTGWSTSQTTATFYRTVPISSIMQRVPTHEPYDQHEDVNPSKFSSAATDITVGVSRANNGIADSANAGIQESANFPEVTPGTCDPEYAKAINAASAQSGISALKAACQKLGLSSPYAMASLLGIAGGESMWKTVEEGFNYQAARLLEVFPSVFNGDQALAQKYAGNPNNSLPEFLYGYTTRKGKGLGNSQPGDGSAFIGRGYIQLTGRGNYTRYAQLSGHDILNNPKLMNDPTIAAEVCVVYLKDRCKADPNSPGYFEAACASVGYNVANIHARKKGYYECFLGQMQAKTVGTGTGGILTDSQGNPVKTGQ